MYVYNSHPLEIIFKIKKKVKTQKQTKQNTKKLEFCLVH